MKSKAWFTVILALVAVMVLWTYGSMKAQAAECHRETPCRIV